MANEYFAAPFHVDGRGRTAVDGDDAHVKDMIYAVLFTAPGERVNRPDFGCGLRQLVFAPNGDVLAGATQFLVMSSLVRWLGDVIRVEKVDVVASDAVLDVHVTYSVLADGTRHAVAFAAPGTAV
jgi:phage baseplate assembly protein W